jgi:hypothetical protein
MREKERQDSNPPSGAFGTGDSLGHLREQAERFLAACDDAISRALAGSDSEAFLRANRQQGGQ